MFCRLSTFLFFLSFNPRCPEPHPALYFSLVIRRNPAFYNTVMVYPSALLSLLTPVMFLTPPSVHDRNSFGKGPFTLIKSKRENIFFFDLCRFLM